MLLKPMHPPLQTNSPSITSMPPSRKSNSSSRSSVKKSSNRFTLKKKKRNPGLSQTNGKIDDCTDSTDPSSSSHSCSYSSSDSDGDDGSSSSSDEDDSSNQNRSQHSTQNMDMPPSHPSIHSPLVIQYPSSSSLPPRPRVPTSSSSNNTPNSNYNTNNNNNFRQNYNHPMGTSSSLPTPSPSPSPVSDLVAKSKKAATSLFLILHAQSCHSTTCTLPSCSSMKAVLLHMKTTCPLRTSASTPASGTGECDDKRCSAARKLLCHHHSCKASSAHVNTSASSPSDAATCLVCSLVTRQITSYNTQILSKHETTKNERLMEKIRTFNTTKTGGNNVSAMPSGRAGLMASVLSNHNMGKQSPISIPDSLVVSGDCYGVNVPDVCPPQNTPASPSSILMPPPTSRNFYCTISSKKRDRSKSLGDYIHPSAQAAASVSSSSSSSSPVTTAHTQLTSTSLRDTSHSYRRRLDDPSNPLSSSYGNSFIWGRSNSGDILDSDRDGGRDVDVGVEEGVKSSNVTRTFGGGSYDESLIRSQLSGGRRHRRNTMDMIDTNRFNNCFSSPSTLRGVRERVSGKSSSSSSSSMSSSSASSSSSTSLSRNNSNSNSLSSSSSSSSSSVGRDAYNSVLLSGPMSVNNASFLQSQLTNLARRREIEEQSQSQSQPQQQFSISPNFSLLSRSNRSTSFGSCFQTILENKSTNFSNPEEAVEEMSSESSSASLSRRSSLASNGSGSGSGPHSPRALTRKNNCSPKGEFLKSHAEEVGGNTGRRGGNFDRDREIDVGVVGVGQFSME